MKNNKVDDHQDDGLKKRSTSSSKSKESEDDHKNQQPQKINDKKSVKKQTQDESSSSSSSSSDNQQQQQQVERDDIVKRTKHATCIRITGLLIITLLTLAMWSTFNYVDPEKVDRSIYLKEMPLPLLEHYQSGSYIPVYDSASKRQFKLFVVQANRDQRQPRESVLLLHGQASTSFSYRQSVDSLYKANLNPILIDLPCYGFSDSLPDCSQSYIADRIPDILNALSVNKVHLVTFDMSTAIGAEFLDRYPKRVASVTLGDPVIDVSHQPFYVNVAKYSLINRALISLATSPYISWIRWKYLQFAYKSPLDQITTDCYFYMIRYRNNINNYIRTIVESDLTFRRTNDLIHSRLHYDSVIPRQAILTNGLLQTYHSVYFQNKFTFPFLHMSSGEFLLGEESPLIFETHVASMVDKIDPELRKLKQIEREEESHGGHGHSHGGNDHGHSHGGHGHSHGGAHGHSHGGNEHGHSHGGAHGHSHGGDEYGMGGYGF